MGLLDGLDKSDRELLLFRRERQTFPAGTVLFREGDPAYHVYYVITGSLDATYRNQAGETLVATSYSSGQIFGLAALLPNGPSRIATVTATSETTCDVVAGNAVELLRQNGRHAAAVRFLTNLLREISLITLRLRDTLPAGTQIKIARFPDYPLDPEEWVARVVAAIPEGILTRLFRKTRYASGEVLIAEGAESQQFHVLKVGSLREESSQGHSAVLHAPALIGQLCLFAGMPQDRTYTAIVESEAVPFTMKALESYLESNPEEAVELLQAMTLLTFWPLLAVEYHR